MILPVESVLKQYIRDYYQNAKLDLPPDSDKREFMIELYGRSTPIRYKEFKTEEDIRKWSVKQAPMNIYCSVSTFERPAERKGFLYADVPLEFDISDYIKSGKFSCSVKHSEKIYCDKCYEFIAKEGVKLYDILSKDFGLSDRDMQIKFSGRRGLHFLITAEDFRTMNKSERISFLEYIRGRNITLEGAGFKATLSKRGWIWEGPTTRQTGWRGRSAQAVAQWLAYNDYPQMISGDVDEAISKRNAFVINRAKRGQDIQKVGTTGEWHKLFTPELDHHNMLSDISKILNRAIKAYCVELDAKVTADIKRVLKIGNSVHGKSGLIAKTFKSKDISTFNPFKEALIAKGKDVEIKLLEDMTSPVPLGGNNISGQKGEKIKVPIGLALHLMAIGLAVMEV